VFGRRCGFAGWQWSRHRICFAARLLATPCKWAEVSRYGVLSTSLATVLAGSSHRTQSASISLTVIASVHREVCKSSARTGRLEDGYLSHNCGQAEERISRAPKILRLTSLSPGRKRGGPLALIWLPEIFGLSSNEVQSSVDKRTCVRQDVSPTRSFEDRSCGCALAQGPCRDARCSVAVCGPLCPTSSCSMGV